LIDQFAAAGRDLCSLDNLHRFRVAAKHLRYAMELFSGALNASCRDLAYQRLVQLQDQLGEINDLRAAIERLDEWLADEKNASRREVFEKTRATIKDLLDQRLTRFRSSWREHESNELLDLLTRALPCASSAEGNGRPADEPRLVAAPRAGDTTSDVR
jgi:CHAD domain-containing protein